MDTARLAAGGYTLIEPMVVKKWVDFVTLFWHCRCVSELSAKTFSSKYSKWCGKHGYHFSEEKALEIYINASKCLAIMPKNDIARLLIEQTVTRVEATSSALAMQSLAPSLPEYLVVMKICDVRFSFRLQLYMQALCELDITSIVVSLGECPFLYKNLYSTLLLLVRIGCGLLSPFEWCVATSFYQRSVLGFTQNSPKETGRNSQTRIKRKSHYSKPFKSFILNSDQTTQ